MQKKKEKVKILLLFSHCYFIFFGKLVTYAYSMLLALIIILIILWVLGYIPLVFFPIPALTLFVINGHIINLWDILILLIIGWAISILPRPLQIIASVLLLFWVLSVLGIFALAGLSSILVLLIIIGLIVGLFI